jgi:hypothetical protein
MLKFTECLDQLVIREYKGRKMVLCTKDEKPFRVQLPRLYMPFGVSGFTPEVGPTKYNVDFSLNGWDEDGSFVQNFYQTLRQVEAKIVEAVAVNSEEIFGEKKTAEELTPLFNSNIKESEGGEYAPKFRVKVDSTIDDRVKCDVFDAQKNRLTDTLEDKLYARNSGKGIAEAASVYFLNKKFGVTWKLYQLQVFEPERLKGFQFTL